LFLKHVQQALKLKLDILQVPKGGTAPTHIDIGNGIQQMLQPTVPFVWVQEV